MIILFFHKERAAEMPNGTKYDKILDALQELLKKKNIQTI